MYLKIFILYVVHTDEEGGGNGGGGGEGRDGGDSVTPVGEERDEEELDE